MLPTAARLDGSRNKPVPTMFATTSEVAATSPIFLSPVGTGTVRLLVLHALHVVLVVVDLHAVRVVAETGERAIPALQRLEIPDVRAVRRAGGFARHHHRD